MSSSLKEFWIASAPSFSQAGFSVLSPPLIYFRRLCTNLTSVETYLDLPFWEDLPDSLPQHNKHLYHGFILLLLVQLPLSPAG